ncbi:MAG: hypothetical protein J0M07_08720 [Anaerolineae bacterium]|nr:hypothetical protein [Chloroflexota bacterium]MBN8635390.1 hypothetical protein [Anaerolineae bacterium]
MMAVTDIRSAKLVDIPVIQRLVEKGTILDSELACTREAISQHMLTNLLPHRNVVTLVGRVDHLRIAGQFRLKADEHLAQMLYIAPDLNEAHGDTAWLELVDSMAFEAGRRGAHMLTGEVDEDGTLFTTLRTAGFAVYARQEVWRRPAGYAVPDHITPAELQPETDADAMEVQLLYCNIVPRLVQPVAVPSSESQGYVYRGANDRIQGYVAVSEGRSGIYVMPFLHPDIPYHSAASILAGAMARVNRADKLPVYICVRRFQDWLEEGLADLGFEPYKQQALMVRHIAAGIRQSVFTPLKQALEVVPAAVRPPTTPISKSVLDQGE